VKHQTISSAAICSSFYKASM